MRRRIFRRSFVEVQEVADMATLGQGPRQQPKFLLFLLFQEGKTLLSHRPPSDQIPLHLYLLAFPVLLAAALALGVER